MGYQQQKCMMQGVLIWTALDEFQKFVDVNTDNIEFENFVFHKEEYRLDEFYYRLMYNKSQYTHAWEIVRKLLVLSHGQAAVERGFSINKHCSMVNQSEDSLVARRFVRDHSNYAGGIENVIVTPGMVTDCKAAGRKYNAHLEKKKRGYKKKKKKKKKKK